MIECLIMRRALAAFLMTLLVAMTSWASACDLSCSLQHFHSLCKLPGTASSVEPEAVPSSDMDMANMDMHDESSLTAQPKSDNGTLHLYANSCTHDPCNETSVSALSKSATERPVHALQLIAFERPSVAAIGWQVTSSVPKRESATLQPLDPLSVNLRI